MSIAPVASISAAFASSSRIGDDRLALLEAQLVALAAHAAAALADESLADDEREAMLARLETQRAHLEAQIARLTHHHPHTETIEVIDDLGTPSAIHAVA
ncbi:MAG: hypothetical protein K8W52_04230 [Deltaproteobacteria bacterium]|nr:hypothetical protein [Deltaproteobacteria bacterium]